MPGPLDGRTVALAEGRQLEELAALLEAEGAGVLRCPLLSILDAPDAGPVEAWVRGLIAGEYGLVVFMTGEAVRRLVGFADRAGLREAFVSALGAVRTLTRGPKPVAALRELGLKPSKVAASPTTDGVIVSLREEELKGKAVGVTLYGSENPKLTEFLASAGATPRTVMPYVFAPAADEERVAGLVDHMVRGAVDVVVFTSSPQVERLWDVAERRGLRSELLAGFARTRVAAVGPLVADALRHRGATVNICPEQGWVMKNLVRQIARGESTPGSTP